MAERPERGRMRDLDPRTLERARAGDLHAFEELVRAYQAEVFRFAWHLTRDRSLAEDVTQETFLRTFRFMGGFRGEQRFGSWLFSIAGTARWMCCGGLGRPFLKMRQPA